MDCEKAYNPAEPVTITMTVEQWDSVLHWLQYGGDYHRAKMQEWLAVCVNEKMGAKHAAMHEQAAVAADTVYKLIHAALYPAQLSTET